MVQAVDTARTKIRNRTTNPPTATERHRRMVARMNDNILYFYVDGGCEPSNPGGYGTWSWSMQYQGRIYAEQYGCLGKHEYMTNNIAEYNGLIEALTYAIGYKDRIRKAKQSIVIRADSQLVVKQVSGRWQCKAEHLIPFYNHAKQLMRDLNATIEWIPRDQNQRADDLCGLAYEEAIR